MTDGASPVLIVGAGPTGLTAAVELSRLGVPVRIIDRAAQPATTSRALAVQARTLELLHPRGAGAEMLRLGNKARSTALHARGRKLATVELHRMPSRFNHVLLLPQSETERLLRELLHRQGVRVERGVELLSCEQSDGGVRAVLRKPGGAAETVRAGQLIAADGAHSGVRHALGLPFDGASLPQRYLLSDLHVDGDLPSDQLSVFLAADGFVAVFPLSGGRFRLMATDPRPHAADRATPGLAELQGICDHVLPTPVRLRDARWSSRFRINSRHLATLRSGAIFFGGDAAHVHSPAGGQGMNTGIQDMINLAWKLAMVRRGQAAPELLDTYQTDRLPVIRALVRSTETATRILNSTNPVLHQAFSRIAPIALGTTAVQDKAAAVLGEVAASYRDSPIAAGGGGIGRLRAGDRVPDADVLPVSGGVAGRESERLHELLDLGRFTLVVCDPAADPAALAERFRPWSEVLIVRQVAVPADQPALRGTDSAIVRDLAARPGLLLVRPDGYLAAAARGTGPERLAGWLRGWLTPVRERPAVG
ncbi:FAD-dependent monooxygenase [Saccharopolyspora sp. NFXS83]|uniref:FAD-dependent monooxygenase n=1 Tax=Saccharopolyspora sp. NFXS83 TaxID=2993560 RepID=UPI00224A603A|nr:FAD-dependent monooxygenase [Saccharopolyspora sp. NFXS83]MCX2730796.1 FAD-dependent monooxygenase [Saccharopolyspora sp. NFXS83]